MGHAWCKEKSSKAQDSKSPIDRVFVRCAHRIYPSLMEEGPVLGRAGATHRVTRSESGYRVPTMDGVAPPRTGKLQRGHSIDSVDRPFHPSEWVDVNLEVPCTPSYALGQPKQPHIARLRSPRASFDGDSGWPRAEEAGGVVPVPPPRRRARRVRTTAGTTDDESEPEQPFASSPGSANRSNATLDSNVDALNNSDDEFVEIEKSLLREQVSDKSTSTEPKNRSTTSLPYVVGMEPGGRRVKETADDEEVAERAPGGKTSSLPRDVSLFELKPKENSERRISTSRRKSTSSYHSFKEDLRENCLEDKSIFKTNASKENEGHDDTHVDVKTSTPIKARTSFTSIDEDGAIFAAQNVHDAFESSNKQQSIEVSSKSQDSFIEKGSVLAVVQGVERAPKSEDDGGYESKSSSQAFLEVERSSAEESSSDILKDAIVNSGDSAQLVVNLLDEQLPGLVVIQRTISEESLPHEMLVEELDGDEEQQQSGGGAESTSKEQQSNLAEEEEFDTAPPCSPVAEKRQLSDALVNGFVDVDECPPNKPTPSASSTTSVTASLLAGLEAALADITYEEEEEEEGEPRVVPVTRLLPSPGIAELEKERLQQSQPIPSLPRFGRTDVPFIEPTTVHREYKLDEPPEKPKRAERCLVEASVVGVEASIVPTPPRRRNRGKPNLSSSADSYASRDRLI